MVSGVKRLLLAVFILTLCFTQSKAQDVTVHGGFLRDSLAIGDEAGYYLTAKYPSKLNILFPDSAYNFTPFEYSRKDYFPTATKDGISYDSAVYYLSTFEVDKYQSLSLPVYQLNPMDCTMYASVRDTIMLSEYVKNLPDTISAQNLPLKENTAYEDVSYLFNYPILIGVLVVLIVVLLIVWIFFGKRITRYYRLKRMQKSHQKFIETYSAIVESIRQSFTTTSTETALLQWKRYMEQLESRPYTKLTSRETTRMENNEALGKNLQTIDGAIYGHSTSVLEPLEQLKTFAQQKFHKRLEEVKHGK